MSFSIPLPVALLIASAWVIAFFMFYINMRKMERFLVLFFANPKRKAIGLILILVSMLAISFSYIITLIQYFYNPASVTSSFLQGTYISGFYGDAIALPLIVLGFVLFSM
ncbi:MAG: hypothetical protein QXL94_08870 [Candidatus Parvarchaeum sp.]